MVRSCLWSEGLAGWHCRPQRTNEIKNLIPICSREVSSYYCDSCTGKRDFIQKANASSFPIKIHNIIQSVQVCILSGIFSPFLLWVKTEQFGLNLQLLRFFQQLKLFPWHKNPPKGLFITLYFPVFQHEEQAAGLIPRVVRFHPNPARLIAFRMLWIQLMNYSLTIANIG